MKDWVLNGLSVRDGELGFNGIYEIWGIGEFVCCIFWSD